MGENKRREKMKKRKIKQGKTKEKT